jgi:hypothetical protein
MSESETEKMGKEQKAQAINAAIKAAGLSQQQHEGTQLDKLLKGIADIHGMCDTLVKGHADLAKRIDDLERPGQPGDGKHLPMHGGKHRGATRVPGDDEDNRSSEDLKTKPKPVVADDGRAVADGWRAHPDGDETDNALHGHGSKHEVLFTDAQCRADEVCNMWGRKSMPPMQSESLLSYRRRLLRPWVRYCEKFKDIDVDTLRGTLLDGVEKIVFADAVAAADTPAQGMGDVLIERTRKDDCGRIIREFHGQPRAWLSMWAGNRRRVVGFRTNFPSN